MASISELGWDALRQRLGYGARPNKYLVEIIAPRGGEVSWAGASNVNLSDPGRVIAFCKGASLPSREMGIVDVWIQGRKIPIPGDAEFSNSWALTFYNDEKHDLRKQFEIWIENLDSYTAHKRGYYAQQYYADGFKISQLDPKNQTEITATWNFYHIYPSGLTNVDFAADAQNQVSEFTVTFTYAHYQRSA